MQVYIYRPIVWAAFMITLIPGILTARAVQKALSIAIQDYMPFGIHVNAILLLFVFLNVIYQMVEIVFSIGISRVCRKRNLNENSAL